MPNPSPPDAGPPHRAGLIGTWLDPDQARARAQPGIKLPGSAAGQGSKWRLELEATSGNGASFKLSCRSGFDHRGLKSSSGLTDGKVEQTVYLAHGSWTATHGGGADLWVISAHTTHTHGTSPSALDMLPGLSPSTASEGVQERVDPEPDSFVVTVERRENGRIALSAKALNTPAPILLVRDVPER